MQLTWTSFLKGSEDARKRVIIDLSPPPKCILILLLHVPTCSGEPETPHSACSPGSSAALGSMRSRSAACTADER
eukprot:2656154-Pyramimonas_sp.AAC.1